MIQRQATGDDTVTGQQSGGQLRQPCLGNGILVRIARADVRMHQRRIDAGKALCGFPDFPGP